jgi:DNA-binding CsgD family transcriptional regulator
MARLTQRDVSGLLQCIGELYALRDVESFGEQALALSRKLVPSAYGTYSAVNTRTKRGWYTTSPVGLDFGIRPEEMETFMDLHPLITHYRDTRDGSARKISDFMSRAHYHESALYREFFRRMGVEDMIAAYLPERPPDSIALVLIQDGRDFTERERLVLNLLRPHMFQAYHNAELITDLHHRTGQAMLALETSSCGHITLDRRGRIDLCTQRARRWLIYWFGCTRSSTTLPGEVQRWLRQQQLPATRTATPPAPRRPLLKERDGSQLILRLVDSPAPAGRVLVMEVRPTQPRVAPLLKLGLTAREAEVLLWVAQGKTNPEIATILGMKAGTVRKHTEHIFQKLGVETRTGAAAQAWAVLGEPDI